MNIKFNYSIWIWIWIRNYYLLLRLRGRERECERRKTVAWSHTASWQEKEPQDHLTVTHFTRWTTPPCNLI